MAEDISGKTSGKSHQPGRLITRFLEISSISHALISPMIKLAKISFLIITLI